MIRCDDRSWIVKKNKGKLKKKNFFNLINEEMKTEENKCGLHAFLKKQKDKGVYPHFLSAASEWTLDEKIDELYKNIQNMQESKNKECDHAGIGTILQDSVVYDEYRDKLGKYFES